MSTAAETRERQRRRKITLACEPCRERKSRCDGRKPICSTCEHRSLGLEQCIYKVGNARTACSDDYTKALHERIRKLEQACAIHGVDITAIDGAGSTSAHLDVNGQSSRHVRSPSVLAMLERRSEQRRASSTGSPEPVDAPENASGLTAMGTVLSEEDLDESTHGMDDFYGRSSAASFLKEAAGSMRQEADNLSRQIPRIQSGPLKGGAFSKFSDVDKFALPPRALADHFLQRYWQRVYYLYPFFDREVFEYAYQTLWASNSDATYDPAQFRGLGLGGAEADAGSIVFHCALNGIFALGCCFSDLSASEKTAAIEVFFHRAKGFVGLDLLDENNLGVVQALLILALILQGTPFPNRCWNAVGVGCRLAQGLGLHTEGGRHSRNAREQEIRRRTWHGCVVMDMLVSMIFGRPTMTSSLSILPGTLDTAAFIIADARNEQIRFSFYRESLRLGVILEGILQKIYEPWLSRDTTAGGSVSTGINIHHSLDAIVELQSQLYGFEQSVPSLLSWISPLVPDGASGEDRAILEIQRNVLHARFIYMLLILHRPILTQLSAPENTEPCGTSDANSNGALLSRDGLHYSFALECGKSCVEAAKRLIRLIYDIYLTDRCGAWWWNALYACTAGTVLIVARLSPALWKQLDHAEIDTLWSQCQSILQHLASFSVSARKSLNLLLKVNDHIILKQAARESGANLQTQFPPEEQAESLADIHGQSQGYIDMMFHLDPTAPSLEETYMMGPMFTWDQSFDFMSGNERPYGDSQ